jgi:HK97 gp10 family phage protein
MAVEVQVDTRRLTALIGDLEPTKIQQLLNRAGFEAEGLAKQRAPVDTGFLRSSLSTKPGPLEVTVGASAKYAPYVELGTRRMNAQPYLGPAVTKAVANLVAALEATFRKAQG